MTSKEYKIVLAGAFGSGRSTFASRFVNAAEEKKKIAALKTETYPVSMYTSAGAVKLTLYDTSLHAKGGLPEDDFFRNADAALVFYDITKQSSFDALEEWYDAVQTANHTRGSSALPTIIVGSKLDLAKDRAVKTADIDFPRKRELPYLEISAKANYKVRELLQGVVRLLVGTGVQLTDEVELAEASVEVDVEGAVKAMEQYKEAAKGK